MELSISMTFASRSYAPPGHVSCAEHLRAIISHFKERCSTSPQGKVSRYIRSVRGVSLNAPPELSAERDATCRSRPTPPRRETTRDRPRRLDDHGCRGCVPGPELCLAPSHNTYRAAALPSQRNDRNANICYYPRDLMIMVCNAGVPR